MVCLLLMSWSSIAQAEMNVCKYFPGPVQTWKDNSTGTLTLTGTPFISNAKVIDGKRYVGMNIKVTGSKKDNPNYVCNQTQCYPASSQSNLYAADKKFPTWGSKDRKSVV